MVVRQGVRFHVHRFPVNALPLLFRDRAVPSVVSHSLQPFRAGPRRRLRRFDGYDVAQFELPAHAGWMGRAPAGARVVYSAHNVEFDYLRTQAPSPLRRGMLRRTAALERRSVEASDLVVACTEADAERLTALYGAPRRLAVVPNGFDDNLLGLDRPALRLVARARLGIPLDVRALLFVGSDALHNVDAVQLLERRVMPALPDDVHLLLAGGCGPATKPHPSTVARVHRLGRVEDLRDVLAAADVGLNPVIYGSGSNLKLAEYLAAGLSVATTPVGMRGFERFAERMVVAEPEGFAAAIRSLDGAASERPPGIEELSWTRLARRLHGAYADLLGA